MDPTACISCGDIMKDVKKQALALGVDINENVISSYLNIAAPITVMHDFKYSQSGPLILSLGYANPEDGSSVMSKNERNKWIQTFKQWHLKHAEDLKISTLMFDVFLEELGFWETMAVLVMDFDLESGRPAKFYLEPDSISGRQLKTKEVKNFKQFPRHAKDNMDWLLQHGFERVDGIGICLLKGQLVLYYLWKDEHSHPYTTMFLKKALNQIGCMPPSPDHVFDHLCTALTSSPINTFCFNVNFNEDTPKTTMTVYTYLPKLDEDAIGHKLDKFAKSVEPHGCLASTIYTFTPDGVQVLADKRFPDETFVKEMMQMYVAIPAIVSQ